MKKFFYLLTMLSMLLNLLVTSPAVAAGHGSKGGTTTTTVALPINTFSIILLASGVLIGVFAIYKYRTEPLRNN